MISSNKQIVLITGSSGMLGKDIFSELFEKGYHVIGVDLVNNNLLPSELQITGDITNEEFLNGILVEYKPDIIIHCAAIVNLKTCEENKKLADAVHIDVTKQLAKFNVGKTILIYISTDSVFDGEKGDYLETDIPNPLNYYAKSKLEGEKAAIINPNSIVVRTNIFGFNNPLKNSLAEWAIKNLLAGNSINGFSDVIFNAIYTKQLAEIIFYLIKKDFKGLINIGSKNKISKYKFLVEIAKNLGVNEDLVNNIESAKINTNVVRPLKTYLNTAKLEKLVDIPTIEEGVQRMINDIRNLKLKLNEIN